MHHQVWPKLKKKTLQMLKLLKDVLTENIIIDPLKNENVWAEERVERLKCLPVEQLIPIHSVPGTVHAAQTHYHQTKETVNLQMCLKGQEDSSKGWITYFACKMLEFHLQHFM